ncbi:MAG: hypothetical protein M0P71_16870 [Melioribacteraceae bacterium]|jgi:hypothetical protein|nr:hypothetical protein [Melioribacteraceae bacterium]
MLQNIRTKLELAEILMNDAQLYDSNQKAIESLSETFRDKVLERMCAKTDAYFIRAFRNRNYDIKLVVSGKFLIQ